MNNVSALEKSCTSVLVYPSMCTIFILSPFQVKAQENAESLSGCSMRVFSIKTKYGTTSRGTLAMQIIRYTSAYGEAIVGLLHHGQSIGSFPSSSTMSGLLHLRAHELRTQIEHIVQSGTANNAPASLLAPIDGETEVWAAGVTYKQSETARKEESGTPDIYAKVYTAQRPELFFKATPRRVAAPNAAHCCTCRFNMGCARARACARYQCPC